MGPLAELVSGDFLSSGLFPGLDRIAGPLWRDGYNVIFENGGVRKDHGLLTLAQPAARPTGLKSTVAGTEPRLFVGAGDKAYRYRSSDGLTEIASFSSSGGVYQFVPWDTWAIISNGVDPVQLWQNAGLAADITAPFTRANTIFAYQLQVFAGGTDNGGALVEWCQINRPDLTWVPALLNSAGNLRLRELRGDIVAAQPIGNSIGIYSASNAGLFSFIGGTAVYGFRKPISGVGAISPYSVVSVGDKHYGITRENAFVTDLVSYVNIDEPAMRNYLRDNADWDRQTEVYGWPDWSNSMVRWAIPKQGGGVFGIGFRVDKGTWTKFDNSVVAGEESGAFTNMLQVTTGAIKRQNKLSPNNDTAALPSLLRSKPLELGSRKHYKRISKLSLDIEWTGDVEFKLGWSNHPNDAVTWLPAVPMANEIFPDQLGLQSELVFLSMQIETTAIDADWKLSGGTIYGELTGLVN